jgi:hypothetical protein
MQRGTIAITQQGQISLGVFNNNDPVTAAIRCRNSPASNGFRTERPVRCADGCEHTGGCEAPAERHDDERLLSGSEATTSLFLSRADSEDANLIEAGPGRSVFHERMMQPSDWKQSG